MYTPTQTRQIPVTIKGAQARSICRILNKAGIPATLTTMGDNQPCFVGATPAQVVAAAHYIESLAGLPWLKILQAGDIDDGHYFTSHMLRWSE